MRSVRSILCLLPLLGCNTAEVTAVQDAGFTDAAARDAGAGAPDAGPDAGLASDAAVDAGFADAGATDSGAPPPGQPPVYISAFAMSHNGPVSDGGEVWVELTVTDPGAGPWTLTSATYEYTNLQLDSAELPFVVAAGEVIRVHGSGYAGRSDAVKTDNQAEVWDVVSDERYPPNIKHGLLWVTAADGTIWDAVVYATGLNQGDWMTGRAGEALSAVVSAGQWPGEAEAQAVLLPNPDREWARLSSADRAGGAASDWQIVGTSLDTYYEPAEGLAAEQLKASLHEIIRGHAPLLYSEVASALRDTDADPSQAGHLIQFYTGRSTENDFNKEHVWAKSHGGFNSDTYAAYADLHHLRPTRPDVNSRRWHLDFDEGGVPYSDSGCNWVEDLSFEPRDAVKGDVARALFYMAVRYEGTDGPTPDLELVEGIPSLRGADGTPTNGPHISTPRMGRLSTLLRWHEQDPPDDFERRRNDVIFERYQGNRNPFVDHPEWVTSIWGAP